MPECLWGISGRREGREAREGGARRQRPCVCVKITRKNEREREETVSGKGRGRGREGTSSIAGGSGAEEWVVWRRVVERLCQ